MSSCSVLVLILLFTTLIFFTGTAYAKKNSLNITMVERISQISSYDGSTERNTGTSQTGVTLSAIQFNGTIVIKNVGLDILSNVNITLNRTANLTSNFSVLYAPSYVNLQYSRISPGANAWIYMRQLNVGSNVTLWYRANPTAFGEPINITESYSKNRIMLGSWINVTVNVTNSLHRPVNLYNVVLTKVPKLYYDENLVLTWFNYTSLSGPDSANARITYSGGRPTLTWNASGKTLNQGESALIYFRATAPISLNVSYLGSNNDAYVRIGNLSATFSFNGTASGLSIKNVNGTSQISIAANKERVNATHWRTSVNFTNIAKGLDYNLTKISIWSTNTSATQVVPDNASILVPSSSSILYPRVAVANGSSYSTSPVTFAWTWVPIVWADANIKILDDGTQIKTLRSGGDKTGGYVFVEEIYVMKGYFIKATKRIVPYGAIRPNVYNVSIVIENIGTQKTPDLMTLFELVPPGFYNIILSTGATDNDRNVVDSENELRITNSTGSLRYDAQSDLVLGLVNTGIISSGSSRYNNYSGFRVDLKALKPNSNGDGVYQSTGQNASREIQILYQINGTGSLSRIQNVYVVGVDPVRLDGAQGSSSMNTSMDVVVKDERVRIVASTFVLLASLIGSAILMSKKDE